MAAYAAAIACRAQWPHLCNLDGNSLQSVTSTAQTAQSRLQHIPRQGSRPNKYACKTLPAQCNALKPPHLLLGAARLLTYSCCSCFCCFMVAAG